MRSISEDRPEPIVAAGPESRRARWKFALLVLLVVGVVVAIRFSPLRSLAAQENVLERLAALRAARGAAWFFVAIYAAAAALALPGSVLTLAGGVLFGVWPGVALNLVGATIGATLAFLLARALGREFVAHRLRGRAAALDRGAERHGFRAILLLRLVPLVPFNALNYGAGLSAVRLRDYVVASVVGMLPGTFAYTYFADALVAGSLEARRDALLHMLAAALLLIALSFLPALARRFKLIEAW